MKRLRLLCISLMLTLGAGFSAPGFADDIRMFWGSGTQTDVTNVLFMIDNSADMETVVSGDYTRLDIVKEGLVNGLELLMGQSNLNVAIGRFTQITGQDPNTPMLFPFTTISEAMTTVDEARNISEGNGIAAGIASSSNDAMETVAGGSMSLADSGLEMVGGGNPGPTSANITAGDYQANISVSHVGNTWTYTVTHTVNKKALESEISNTGCSQHMNSGSLAWNGSPFGAQDFVVSFELDDNYAQKTVSIYVRDNHGNNTVDINGPDCNTVVSGPTGPQKIGLRFTELDIPQGATIESATIDFVSTAAASAATLTIKAENTDGPIIY